MYYFKSNIRLHAGELSKNEVLFPGTISGHVNETGSFPGINHNVLIHYKQAGV